MAQYRVYHIVSGRFFGAPNVVEAGDDAGALTLAAEQIRYDAVEIWTDDRCVGLLPSPTVKTRLDPRAAPLKAVARG